MKKPWTIATFILLIAFALTVQKIAWAEEPDLVFGELIWDADGSFSIGVKNYCPPDIDIPLSYGDPSDEVLSYNYPVLRIKILNENLELLSTREFRVIDYFSPPIEVWPHCEEITGVFEGEFTPLPPNAKFIEADIDHSNDLGEGFGESNNNKILVIPPTDLVIENIAKKANNKVEVTIKNNGARPIGSDFTTRIEFLDWRNQTIGNPINLATNYIGAVSEIRLPQQTYPASTESVRATVDFGNAIAESNEGDKNKLTVPFKFPDLVAKVESFDPAQRCPIVKIKNQGGELAGASAARIRWIKDSGVPTGDPTGFSVQNLNSNSAYQYPVTPIDQDALPSSMLPPPDAVAVKVEVDTAGAVNESVLGENNNVTLETFPYFKDLIVEWIDWQGNTVNFALKNQGGEGAGAFYYRATCKSNTGSIVGVWDIELQENLAPGQSVTKNTNCYAPASTVEISLDINNEVTESNEENNIKTGSKLSTEPVNQIMKKKLKKQNF